MTRATYPPRRRKLTVPAVAEQLGVAPTKVMDWIRAGELRAINLARRADGRPRYSIDVADLAAFEQARAVIPTDAAQVPRVRSKLPAGVKKFF